MMVAALALGYVVMARLAEMVLARRNTRRLIAAGAHEASPGHYPLLIALHVGWLAALAWWAPGQPVQWGWLALFAALQPLRIWVMATLGARWTARIVVVPGETLVNHGPYRWMRHPNYAVVVGELASLPLAFGLWRLALVVSSLNFAALAVRIRAEDAALAPARGHA